MAKARRTLTETLPAEQPLADPIAAKSEDDPIAGAFDRDRIARRAYELYLARGGADGQDLQDWLSAERELSPDDRD
jgi:hypothetical protein